MTRREQEIFDIIRRDPTIEQSAIAAMLNITRSSVAVHISNLQKKGYILGKGYLLKEEEYVIGIGAANVDLHGQSKASVILRDSNPGHLHTSAGGVTRNVCENLARLGVDIKLITALGDDVYANLIKQECAAAGVDYSHSMVVDNHSSSTYISILDEQGDMLVAMSDMTVLQQMTMEYLKQKSGLIKGAKIITCDGGLPESVLEGIVATYSNSSMIFVDPVSCAYAAKVKPYIGQFHTAKPNKMELEVLSGMEIYNHDDLMKAGTILLEQGLKRIFISLGADGCLYMDRNDNIIKKRLKPMKQMVNASGAGDSFMAAVIYSTMQDFDIEKTINYGLAAGVAAISSEKTINPYMNVELLKKILKERKE